MPVPVTAPEYQAPNGWRTGSPFLQLVRVTTEFLQGLFAQLPTGAYRWSAPSDDGASEIYIGMETPTAPDVTGSRPAVTVTRGAGAFQGTAIGDLAYYDMRTGAQVRMDVLPVTLSINVLSRIPVEAEELAWFIQRHIWALRDKLIVENPGILYIGSRPSISPPSPAGSLISPDSEHNWVVVSVSFPAYLQYSATTIPLNAKILGGIDVDAVANADYAVTVPEIPEITDPSQNAFAIPAPTPIAPVLPIVPLQGTAVNQPQHSTANTLALPQTPTHGGQYKQPVILNVSVTKD